MRKFVIDNDVLYIGEMEEIKTLYKKMEKAFYEDRTITGPKFDGPPILKNGKIYGIYVIDEPEEYYKWFQIVNSDTIATFLSDGVIK